MLCFAHADGHPDYQIGTNAHKAFAGADAHQLVEALLAQHPEIKRRMREPAYTVPGEDWGYYDQCYQSDEVMLHLLALQVKAMSERREIKSIDDLLDNTHGIGSKNHKDKGTINNPLSIWGHPVQTEILGKRSRLKALKVYHAFRKTLKNELIRYGRSQSLEWHYLPKSERLEQTLDFLERAYPSKTKALQEALEDMNMELPKLLQAALTTHLIS